MTSGTFTVKVLDDEGGDESRSLAAWLREEDEFKVRAVTRSAEPGRMGGVLETIEVLIQPEGLGVALVTAISTWLSTRRTRSTIVITRDGRTATVELPRGADVVAVTKSVVDQLNAE